MTTRYVLGVDAMDAGTEEIPSMALEIQTTDGTDIRGTYGTRAQAAEAVRQARGWSAVVLSPAFAADGGDAVCAYETREECDADTDGARADRIVVAGR